MARARTTMRRMPPGLPCLVISLLWFLQTTASAQSPRLSIEDTPFLPPPISQYPGAGILAEFSRPAFPQEEVATAHHETTKPKDDQIQQVGCDSKGPARPLGSSCGAGSCSSGLRPYCGPGPATGCSPCALGEHRVGRFLGGLHESLCCPDPCYKPRWQPLADSAFHVAAARPVTHQRIRVESGFQLEFPDRAEFFWARQDGQGRGPQPLGTTRVASNRIRYNDLTYYVEGGSGVVSAIVEVPYRSMDPDDYGHSAGFGDIKAGMKTLLFDCELAQVAVQVLAYTPTGDPGKGLGVGHASVEPSLLFGLRVGPQSYVQGQVSEWIPLGGDATYSGAVLHTHVSFNQEVVRVVPDSPLIATFSFNSWSFQDGGYTDPVLGYQRAGGFTYMSVGGGARLFLCDRMDLGFAATFAVRDPHFAAQLYTADFRFRF